MSKKSFPIDQVLLAMREAEVSPEQRDKMLNHLKKVAKEEAVDAEDDKQPRTKNTFTVILSDPEGKYAGQPLVGWVIQHSEEIGSAAVTEKIGVAKEAYLGTRKARRNPPETPAALFENATLAVFKELGLILKTRMPVEVVPLQDVTIPAKRDDAVDPAPQQAAS